MRSPTGLGLLVATTTTAALLAAAPASQAGTGAVTLGPGAYAVDTSALTITGPGTDLSGVDVGGVAVFTFRSLSIQGGATLTVTGARPLELKAATTLSVAGRIVADGGDANDATPAAGGPGGGAGGGGDQGASWTAGVGPGAGGAAAGKYSGAGGAAFGGGGTTGGKSNVDAFAGSGGTPYGNLNTAFVGGSGGGGASDIAGGGGGGAVALVGSTVTVANTGVISADGGDGASGSFGASGGGSGGGVVLHATTLRLNGTVRADGGDGGGGGCCGDGGAGGGGRIALQYSSYSASGFVLSVAGGTSGAVGTSSGVASPDPSGAAGVVSYRTLDATALTIGPSQRVRKGAHVVVRTRLTRVASGKAFAKQTVTLLRRPSRTAPWRTVATRTTSTTGTATVRVRAKRTAQYQWRYAGDWTHGSAVSPVQTVRVRR